MEEITAIVIDDEAPARDIIRHYLKDHPCVKIVAECSDGFEGLKAIREKSPDLLFLDIQMPRLTGFEMLEVMEEKPHIIFITAYDQYAIKAFEQNAVDYLLKPVDKVRFSEAIEKVKNRISAGTPPTGTPTSLLRQEHQVKSELTRVVVKKGSTINIIPVSDIRYLEAHDDYVMIYHNKGKAIKQHRMKYFNEKLPANMFSRIHRSYIVRLGEIDRLEPYGKESFVAVLKGGERLPVSKSGYSNLKRELLF